MKYGGGWLPLLSLRDRGAIVLLKNRVFSDLILSKRNAAENCSSFGKLVRFAHRYKLMGIAAAVHLKPKLFAEKEL